MSKEAFMFFIRSRATGIDVSSNDCASPCALGDLLERLR